jgi:ATP-binding cassette, subfamily A (ABC1), member 3
VAGISLALIPASIVTRIVNEKELGMHHMQIVSGVDLKAYWMSFFVFDIVKSYLPCIMIAILIELFNLKYKYVWIVLCIYPWAVVPFSYVTSHLFNRESTA